ncbi:hypothetical protein BA190_32435 [Labrys sp. WJW]|nr:hypothetical protein BA190_32435 [Labrys sp. WJW]
MMSNPVDRGDREKIASSYIIRFHQTQCSPRDLDEGHDDAWRVVARRNERRPSIVTAQCAGELGRYLPMRKESVATSEHRALARIQPGTVL